MTNPLSKRESEVLTHLLQGKSNKLIAASLDISERTVEFHLKNIYAKYQVSSRMELVLKLGNATGEDETKKLWHSTVADLGEKAENRANISIFDKESNMKNLLNTKHVAVGVITALFTGFAWIALYRYFVNMSTADIQAWLVPSMVAWALIGLSIGLIGKRNGNTPLKVWFTTMVGTGFSPITILPLMGFVVLPVGKLLQWMGLIDPATMPHDVAQTLAITAMLTVWFFVGTTMGIMLLFVTIKKPEQKVFQTPVPEHRL